MTPTDQELLKQLPRNHGHGPLYRLRWRFVFSDGRPDRIGGWNSTSQNQVDMAAFVKKNNLLYAIIEGEKHGAWTVKRFLEIDGHQYATCKWRCALTAPMLIKTDMKFTRSGEVVGLEMHTNDHAYTVFVDGQIKSRPLTEHESQFKLAEHSMGG